MSWSMYKTEFLTEEHEMVQRFPHAVSHDGVNTVFVAAPADQAGAFVVPGDLELAELITAVGGFLISQTDTPLIATKDQLVALFRTPHHRLWCAAYESDDAPTFLADKAELGIPVEYTQAQAKEVIKSQVSL